jgi:hypothetical protein
MNTLRNGRSDDLAASDNPTPADPEREARERYRLYRLCPCADCDGLGKVYAVKWARCKSCRGEGRALELLATCATPEAVGVTIVTLAREHELDECPIGLLDRMPEPGDPKWLVLPWLPSPRNVSDAGRLLQRQRDIQ